MLSYDGRFGVELWYAFMVLSYDVCYSVKLL